MTAYIARRLVHMVPVLFLITLFVFFLVRLVPGDPASVMLGPRATPKRIAALKKTPRRSVLDAVRHLHAQSGQG